MRRISLLGLLPLMAAAQPLEVVQLTDTHVIQAEGIHPSLLPQRVPNLLSAAQLEKFFEDRRSAPPAFFLHTGDILEAFRYDGAEGRAVDGQIERFQAIIRRSAAPVYLALGNRDVSWYRAVDGKQVVVRDSAITTEARAAWSKAFECFRGGTWYSFEKRVGETAYLFAVLDNGETSDQAMVQRQLGWLRRTLVESKAKAVVVGVHIPLSENAFGASVKEILNGVAKPALVLAGHRHTDGVEEISAAPKQVQVRTASFAGGKMSWRRIVLREAGIDVHATSEADRILFTIPVGGAH